MGKAVRDSAYIPHFRVSGELPRHCPDCGADNQGDPIPDDLREAYGNATHFLKWISLYSRERDRTIAHLCPNCNLEIPRD